MQFTSLWEKDITLNFTSPSKFKIFHLLVSLANFRRLCVQTYNELRFLTEEAWLNWARVNVTEYFQTVFIILTSTWKMNLFRLRITPMWKMQANKQNERRNFPHVRRHRKLDADCLLRSVTWGLSVVGHLLAACTWSRLSTCWNMGGLFF